MSLRLKCQGDHSLDPPPYPTEPTLRLDQVVTDLRVLKAPLGFPHFCATISIFESLFFGLPALRALEDIHGRDNTDNTEVDSTGKGRSQLSLILMGGSESGVLRR